MRKSIRMLLSLVVMSCFSSLAIADIGKAESTQYEIKPVELNGDKTITSTNAENTSVLYSLSRIYNVTDGDTLLANVKIYRVIEQSVIQADIITANQLPTEVGWRF